MLRGHDLVLESGGTCVMVNVNCVGLAAVAHLRRHSQLPIHGHRANFGAMARHPLLGIGFCPFQKIFRLAGVDHLHVGGFNSKFYENNAEVAQSILDCLTPLFGDYRVMPAISSAQWAGSAIDIYVATETIDVVHLAGGGIIAHPRRYRGRRAQHATRLGGRYGRCCARGLCAERPELSAPSTNLVRSG